MLPHALRSDPNQPAFVEVEEMPKVAGTHDVRSFVGALGKDTLATLWHYLGKDGHLTVKTANVAAYDVQDLRSPVWYETMNKGSVRSFDYRHKPIELKKIDDSTAIPLGAGRVTLHFPGIGPGAVRKLLESAKLELRRPDVFWIRAEDYQDRVGAMTKVSEADVDEPEALSDPILAAGPIDRTGKTPSYCEYSVTIPRKATWTLWARVRYPTGGDMSFGLVRPNQEVTLTGSQVLGKLRRERQEVALDWPRRRNHYRPARGDRSWLRCEPGRIHLSHLSPRGKWARRQQPPIGRDLHIMRTPAIFPPTPTPEPGSIPGTSPTKRSLRLA